MTATIFDISRGSVHDGTGLRTVVYLKGCKLNCIWCHNPEGISPKHLIRFDKNKCIGCGRCNGLASHPFLEPYCDHKHQKAIEACPTTALSICGYEITAEALLREVKKDIHYYGEIGGVTLSGGEPLLQSDFIKQFFSLCKKEKIHTCVESALYVPQENILSILDVTDLFIADLKAVDDTLHIKGTGHSNEQILENHKYLAKKHDNIWVRTPLIPTLTDTDENKKACINFVKALGETVKKHEFLDFNPLYAAKYEPFGIKSLDIIVKE